MLYIVNISTHVTQNLAVELCCLPIKSYMLCIVNISTHVTQNLAVELC